MENLGEIGFSETQGDLLEIATKFAQEKSPIEKVRTLMTDDTGYDPDVWREIVELGWLSIAIPEEFDGLGLSLGDVTPIMEQLGRRLLASPFFVTTLGAQALIAGGTEDQKKTWLPKLGEGAVATLALAEKNNDWDLANVTSAAESTGGEITLRGVKRFVEHADAADLIVASVLYDGAPALVLIENKEIPDGALRRETIIDETKRSYEVTLDGVTVAPDAILDVARAAATLKHIHLCANLLAAAEMVGAGQGVIEYTVEYLNTRKQFGKLIGSYQSLKHPTVEAFVRYEQARSHVYSAAHSCNDQGAGEVAIRMAKAEADAVLSFAADRSIQFHGGFGFTYDCDAQLYRRRAIWHASQYGDAYYHRKLLAELLL